MHCKSGADRVGIASCLYLIYRQKYNVSDASKQLSFKFLHIKYAKTGVKRISLGYLTHSVKNLNFSLEF